MKVTAVDQKSAFDLLVVNFKINIANATKTIEIKTVSIFSIEKNTKLTELTQIKNIDLLSNFILIYFFYSLISSFLISSFLIAPIPLTTTLDTPVPILILMVFGKEPLSIIFPIFFIEFLARVFA
jgi:hypothetical protein